MTFNSAPAAESYAFKDAAEKFGKIFGKDINRKDNITYIDRIYASINAMETFGNPNIPEDIREKVANATTEAELKVIWEAHKGLGKEFSKLVTEQKKFIESVAKEENEKS